MRGNNTFILVPLMVAGICCTGTASAADSCTGTYSNVNQSAETLDLGNGVSILSSFDRAGSQHNSGPYAGMLVVGTCSAYVATASGGKSRVVYACARKSKDGDVAVDEGTLEPGADRGTWKITSGTGALAKMIGSNGWWQPAVSDGKITMGTWGGTCNK